MLHISLAAEKIFSIGPFPVTNSLLSTWFVMALLFALAYFGGRSVKKIPSNFQSILEILISGLYEFFESVMGHHIKKAFPVIASLFLFIIISNWMGLLPGFGTIGFFEEAKAETSHETVETIQPAVETHEQVAVANEHETVQQKESKEIVNPGSAEEATEKEATHAEKKLVPFFRGPTADLNMTIALACIAFIAIQYFGFSTLGFHYSKRFLNLSNPIMFFVGILELVSDLSKIVSFAFRLFGNVFAGEVLLSVMAFLMPFIAPMPFLLLELFVGFIQALVFSTLTAVFINVAVQHEE